MFKKWFGGDKQPTRNLQQPDDLNTGDMLEFIDSFGLPKDIRGKTFSVAKVHTYEFKRYRETEFLLKGDTNEAFTMTVEEEDGERWINLMMKIERDEVESLFDMDAFSSVFDEEPSRENIKVIEPTDEYQGWVAKAYRQSSDWKRGYYYEADLRGRSPSKYESDEGEAFEMVSLASDDDMFSVEIEVWPDGETEVFLCMTRPVADIKGLYGKSESSK